MSVKRKFRSFMYPFVCVGGFVAILFILMGISAWEYVARNPSGSLFDNILRVGMPIGMGVVTIVICIGVYRDNSATIADLELSGTTIPTVGMPETTGSPDEGEAIITLPAKCSNCGAALAMDEVDWVGPLQFKCPNCGATQFATKKRI